MKISIFCIYKIRILCPVFSTPFSKKFKMKPEEKLELIQEKLEKLSAKQLKLNKSYQEKVKSYEEEKSLYQRLFGKEPLPKDLELEAIKTEIADLKEDKKELYKVIQVRQNRNL